MPRRASKSRKDKLLFYLWPYRGGACIHCWEWIKQGEVVAEQGGLIYHERCFLKIHGKQNPADATAKAAPMYKPEYPGDTVAFLNRGDRITMTYCAEHAKTHHEGVSAAFFQDAPGWEGVNLVVCSDCCTTLWARKGYDF